jgi:hypothetical protein
LPGAIIPYLTCACKKQRTDPVGQSFAREIDISINRGAPKGKLSKAPPKTIDFPW